LTAVWIPSIGFSDTTGQSLPNASGPRPAAMLRYGQPRDARSSPMLRVHTTICDGVGTPWNGCIEAITPSAPNRLMSAGSTVSMCSMRCRRPRAGAGFERAACA
jgi:hypothetical protein